MSAFDKIDRYIERYEDMIYKVGILLFFWVIVIAVPAHKLIQDRAHITLLEISHQEYVKDTNVEMGQLTDKITDLSIKYQKTEMFRRETNCLAENIYYEAGTQGKEGMEAVAQVTLNRKRAGFAPSICGVVHQEGCQFSWTCSGYARKPKSDDERWIESQRVARELLEGGYDDYRAKYANAKYFHRIW